jgi:hypothetical protein
MQVWRIRLAAVVEQELGRFRGELGLQFESSGQE